MKLAPESIISGTALIALSYYSFSLKTQIDSIENRLETKALKAQVESIENRLETKIGSFEDNLKQLEIKHTDISTALDTIKRGEGTAFAESRKLVNEDTSPFNCDKHLCTAKNKMFLFPESVIIGAINADCQYGEAVLSVDVGGNNCPSGSGSVTFGSYNIANGKYSTVTGGHQNSANGKSSTVSGGKDNSANGTSSSVTGGSKNSANDVCDSVSGGYENIANGRYSTVTAGYRNSANGDSSSVSGGAENYANGNSSSVSGGYQNFATGDTSSVSGGYENSANGDSSSVSGGAENSADVDSSSVSGGSQNSAEGWYSSVSGGDKNFAKGDSSSVLGGENNVAIKDFGTVWKNVCKDNMTDKFSAGKLSLTCEQLSKKKKNKDKICKRSPGNSLLESASVLCPVTCNTCDVG